MGERRSTTLVLSPTLNFTLTVLIRRCTTLSISVRPGHKAPTPVDLGRNPLTARLLFREVRGDLRTGGLSTVSGIFIMKS